MFTRDVSLIFLALAIFSSFSVSQCHHFSEFQINTYFQNYASKLKNVPNISEKLNKNPIAVLNENGTATWNVNLNNIFCTLLVFARITTLCRRQMEIVCAKRGTLGTMIDAWSKFPFTGMEVTSAYDFGTYDECVSIDLERGGLRVLGKHCIGGLILPTTLNITEENLLSSIVGLSYCVPDRCTGNDVFHMIAILPIRELINDQVCSTKVDNSTYEGNAIPIMFIFLMFIAVAIISTVFDITLQMNNKKIQFPLLTAFSFYSNGKKLFKTSPISSGNNEQILCFHGIKVISMMWITAGHYAVAWESLPVVNDADVKDFSSKRYSQYLATAHLAVDTFFFISGFLLAYQYFKKQGRTSILGQVKSLPMLVVQRYLRLTPSLLMVYLFIIGLARYVTKGPLQALEQTFRENCAKRWWSIFLYIENYYDWRNMCLASFWYISADMQIFLAAPLIMIPIAWQLKKSFNAALIELMFFCMVFTGLPLFTKLWFPEYDPDYGEYDAHSRFVDYFIGFTFGFVIRQKRDKPFIFSKFMNFFLWFLALAALLATIFVLHEINMHHGYVAKAYTYTFMRPVWCLSLCWIVYSCIHGKAGAINWILSNGLMQCGGRLTYAMYLLHVLPILQWTLSTRTSRYFSDLEMFYICTGIFILTWVICVFWTLMFESPVMIILKVLLEGSVTGRRPPPVNKPNNLENTQNLARPVNDDNTTLEYNLNKNELKLPNGSTRESII